MKYNPNIHHRRSIRLKNYNYSQAGMYFITIGMQNRFHLFGEIVNGKMVLVGAGPCACPNAGRPNAGRPNAGRPNTGRPKIKQPNIKQSRATTGGCPYGKIMHGGLSLLVLICFPADNSGFCFFCISVFFSFYNCSYCKIHII